MGSHGDAGFATTVGDGFDATVVQETASIENGASDALLDTHLSEKLTNFGGTFDRLTLPLLLTDDVLNLGAHRPERGERLLVFVVDDLHVHVLVRAVDRNTRSIGGTRNLREKKSTETIGEYSNARRSKGKRKRNYNRESPSSARFHDVARVPPRSPWNEFYGGAVGASHPSASSSPKSRLTLFIQNTKRQYTIAIAIRSSSSPSASRVLGFSGFPSPSLVALARVRPRSLSTALPSRSRSISSAIKFTRSFLFSFPQSLSTRARFRPSFVVSNRVKTPDAARDAIRPRS